VERADEISVGVDSLSDSQADGRRRKGCHEEEQKIYGRLTLQHAVDMGGNVTIELLISGSQVQSLRVKRPRRNASPRDPHSARPGSGPHETSTSKRVAMLPPFKRACESSLSDSSQTHLALGERIRARQDSNL
jgi:hypothetical protein